MTEINACCQNPENRTEAEQTEQGLTVQRCKICGRRHFELAVDPATIGVTVT